MPTESSLAFVPKAHLGFLEWGRRSRSTVTPGEGNAYPFDVMAFTTTHWSIVLEAQGESPAARRALEILCRTYWQPLYGFVRRQGFAREEAQDLVQDFFARLLEHRNLETVRREKGRLRSYLLVSLKHFLASERRRAIGVKRYETGPHLPLDERTDRLPEVRVVAAVDTSSHASALPHERLII